MQEMIEAGLIDYTISELTDELLGALRYAGATIDRSQ
jgi:hypothetical protein